MTDQMIYTAAGISRRWFYYLKNRNEGAAALHVFTMLLEAQSKRATPKKFAELLTHFGAIKKRGRKKK